MDSKKPVLSVVKSSEKPTKKKPSIIGGGGSGGSGDESKAEYFGNNYLVKENCFYQLKNMRDGQTLEILLATGVFWIEKAVVRDSGLAEDNFFRISGRRANGQPLPIVDVPLKQFYTSLANWINEAHGTKVFISTGVSVKDNLRAAIEKYSVRNGDVPTHTIYQYSGWKYLNDEWVYLTGNGGINKAGLVNDIEVDLGVGNMQYYRLPAPLTGNALKEAAEKVLLILDVFPNKSYVGLVLLAAMARAPLGECKPIDFIIWLYGKTGCGKSSMASIMLSFFGDFDKYKFTSNFEDSVGQCEVKAHAAKDAVFIVDDYKPSVNIIQTNKLKQFVERFVRNTGNQSARDTMTSKALSFNRSLTIATAEDTPEGASILGRMLILELTEQDANLLTLKQLEAIRDMGGVFSGFMASYLQWLAPQIDELKLEVPKIVKMFEQKASNEELAKYHTRGPELYGNLSVGVEIITEFLRSIDGLENPNKLIDITEQQLKEAFSLQGSYQEQEDEVIRFLELFRAVFDAGNGHISCYIDQGPPKKHPYNYGWRKNGIDDDPLGDCLGWHVLQKECEYLYLSPDVIFEAITKAARNQGKPFLMGASTLWRRLHDKGYLVQVESKTKLTVKKTVLGVKKRVLVINASLIENPD